MLPRGVHIVRPSLCIDTHGLQLWIYVSVNAWLLWLTRLIMEIWMMKWLICYALFISLRFLWWNWWLLLESYDLLLLWLWFSAHFLYLVDDLGCMRELFVGYATWLYSWFKDLLFQPCLYPMKTVHPGRLYTPPRRGVAGGHRPPLGGSRGQRPPRRKNGLVKLYCNFIVNLGRSL